MKLNSIITFVVFSCLTLNLSGQIRINEYSASNLNNFQDNYERTEDWIELYNTSPNAEDIGGWFLSDKDDKPEKWEIPAGTIIPPNGYLVFWCSGRDEVKDGHFHTNFKLSQTSGKDEVSLADSDGEVVEVHDMIVTLVEHSICRDVDGGGTWKVCTNPSLGSSNNFTTQYDRYTIAPTIDLEAGYYTSGQMVTITNNEPNSVLRYTVDGTNPTTSSLVYSNPIPVTQTTVVKAQSFSNDANVHLGKMDFNTYFINEDFSLAVFSVAADSVLELAGGAGSIIPIGSIEYFNLDKEREATSFGSLNRHGQDSWVLPHRSLDWVSRDEMGYSKAVEAPLFSYSERDEYQKFMFRNSGDDNYPAINDFAHQGSCHIRDEYVQTLAQDGNMELDLRAVERVILFLNGQYWGVYGMRERPVDHDYTDEYYDQGKYDLEYLSTWGNTDIEYGGELAKKHWEDFRDFILENDMSEPANYTIVTDSLNVLSMIDYMIVNLNVVASDWLNYNTGWWRGLDPDGGHKKWGYILWDLDATFDYYINYSGVPNTNPDADPCDLEEIGEFMDEFFNNEGLPDRPAEDCNTIINGSSPYPADDSLFVYVIIQDNYCCETDWDNICQEQYDAFLDGAEPEFGDVGQHEKIFLKLLDENDEFRQLYYSRQADMMNTVYDCENMLRTLEEMLAVIEPEMPRQIDRWGGSLSEWEENVEDLIDFIEARCSLLDDGMLECYSELSGPYDVTLLVEPQGIGTIDFNTLELEEFPWVGGYFGGMQNKIGAKVLEEYEDNWSFSHWETKAGNIITPDMNSFSAEIALSTADTLIAVFDSEVSTHEQSDLAKIKLYPNPASKRITLDFELAESADVNIELHNLVGQKLISFTEQSGKHTSGAHSKSLNLQGHNIQPGVYLMVMQVDESQLVRKVTVL